MLKHHISLKARDLEQTFREQFRGFLLERPIFRKVRNVVPLTRLNTEAWQPDLLFSVEIGKESWRLVCEIKANSQPRHVRAAVLQLRDYVSRLGKNAYGVLLASYVSPESAAICSEAGIGFFDSVGNCRLSFDHVHIEISSETKPAAAKREQRSIFKPKSARVLRAMLAEPNRAWRGVDLVSRAQVSLGQVSNVRKGLLAREWAQEEEEGIRLSSPITVLVEWRNAIASTRVERANFHTVLHGSGLEEAIRAALRDTGRGEHAILASFSAAAWMAPFGRSPTTWFRADEKGEETLVERLRLEPVKQGGNVSIVREVDKGVFLDRIEPAPGVWTTGLAQTYLDLYASGERGAEAAEHLLQQKIVPQWGKS